MAINVNDPKEVRTWAEQCLALTRGFEQYLKAVKRTGKMNPPGRTENAYTWGQRFYGENGTLAWINDGLGSYAPSGWYKRIQR